eukprot:GHVS01107141.1.p1 GENE.GHVS01107141.1~~GHVS01107141.1.p1  ORF type:complete len:214 (+),score=24.22 GHVS01107141.1:149-790(+)
MSVVSPVRQSPLVKLKERLTTSCFYRDNRGRVWGLVCVLLLGQSTMPLNAQPFISAFTSSDSSSSPSSSSSFTSLYSYLSSSSDSSAFSRSLSSSSSSSFLGNRSSITPLSSKSPRSLAPIFSNSIGESQMLLTWITAIFALAIGTLTGFLRADVSKAAMLTGSVVGAHLTYQLLCDDSGKNSAVVYLLSASHIFGICLGTYLQRQAVRGRIR